MLMLERGMETGVAKIDEQDKDLLSRINFCCDNG